MSSWEQLTFDPRFTGAQLDVKITFPPEGQHILVTCRGYGLPNHHQISETFQRFNRTPPGLLRAISEVADQLVTLREIHGVYTNVIEVSEIVELPEDDPTEPF